MIKHGLIGSTAVLAAFGMAVSGCATKKYVRNHVDPVSQQVSTLQTQQTQTTAKLDNLSTRQGTELSQLSERLSTTDNKLNTTSAAANQAQGTASRAMDSADANAGRLNANSQAISNLGTGVANSLNYQLVDKADITFGFAQDTLTDDAKAALDQVATRAQGLPRSQVEVVGFTDMVGPADYNMELSVRRAEAVRRYLVLKNVPLRSITIVGLGEEKPPAGLEADLSSLQPNPPQSEVNRLARRVRISIFGAGNISQGNASRSQQQ